MIFFAQNLLWWKERGLIFLKKMADENELKAEIGSEYYHLTRRTRRLLKCFFGYLKVEGKREKLKDKKEAPAYLQKALWPTEGDVDREEEDKAFEMDELGMDAFKRWPTLFSNKAKDVETFFLGEGVKLDNMAQCGIVRGMQKFQGVYPPTLQLKKTHCIGYLGGR